MCTPYPTAAIGQAALQGTGRTKYSGTVEELLSVMVKGGISYAFLANVTPTYDMKMAGLRNLSPTASREEGERAEKEMDAKMIDRMKRRNFWTCAVARENPGLVPLIGIDLLQTPEDMEQEIEEMAKKHGAKGVKLHPLANRFFPYDQRLWRAYAKAMELGLPILFHSGQVELAGSTDVDYARPKNFERVLGSFPNLKIILAHLGRGFLKETIEIAQKYEHVYFDTSAAFPGIGGEGEFKSNGEAVELLRKIGIKKIFFGSDWPWLDSLLCIEQIKNLSLREEEKRGVLGENAADIFGLDIVQN